MARVTHLLSLRLTSPQHAYIRKCARGLGRRSMSEVVRRMIDTRMQWDIDATGMRGLKGGSRAAR